MPADIGLDLVEQLHRLDEADDRARTDLAPLGDVGPSPRGTAPSYQTPVSGAVTNRMPGAGSPNGPARLCHGAADVADSGAAGARPGA